MSAAGFHSDSQVLVDRCLARLRADAHLGDEPILPTIEALLVDDDDDDFLEVHTDELIIDCADVKEVPSAASIVSASVRANTRARGEASRPIRWPVLLCALVATYCGVTAVLRSPLGADAAKVTMGLLGR